MFTVNSTNKVVIAQGKIFQNISCLRLIEEVEKIQSIEFVFQNISCLRLIIMGTSIKLNNN